VNGADAAAAELGRHYVAGHLEADELDQRLARLYAAPESAALLLDDLPGLEAAAPAPVASRKGWWRRRHGESEGHIRAGSPRPSASSTPRPTG
jgi:DUF1707 SHOCT-like domain